MGIINYGQAADQTLNNLLNNPKISAANKGYLKDFAETYDVSDGRKYVFYLHIKRFLLAHKDLKEFIQDRKAINTAYNKFRKELSPSMYATLINVSKRFATYLNDGDKPIGFKDLKTPPKKTQKRKLDVEDMLTWDEGLKLADTTNSVQIKAVILTQLDGGLRPSEFMELTYGDVRHQPPFIILHVKKGKTGTRDVFVYHAVPYLLKWLENHPNKKKNAPLWVKESRKKDKKGNYITKVEAYNYPAILKRIRECAKKAGINKPLSFYNLRHSAVTLSKKDNIPTDEAADKFGHSVGHYTETYGRLDITDHLNRISQAYGLEEQESGRRKNNIKCSRCNAENPSDAPRCSNCQTALTLKLALAEEQDTKQMIISAVAEALREEQEKQKKSY